MANQNTQIVLSTELLEMIKINRCVIHTLRTNALIFDFNARLEIYTTHIKIIPTDVPTKEYIFTIKHGDYTILNYRQRVN